MGCQANELSIFFSVLLTPEDKIVSSLSGKQVMSWTKYDKM